MHSPRCLAWETNSLSKGSPWIRSTSSIPIACSGSMLRVDMPLAEQTEETKVVVGTGSFNFPIDFLIAISQIEATLKNKLVLTSSMEARAFFESDELCIPIQRKICVSSNSSLLIFLEFFKRSVKVVCYPPLVIIHAKLALFWLIDS